MALCPCGTGAPLAACCGRYLAGAPAPTAEALMRSRYTAFVREDVDHLLASWHPATAPTRDELVAGFTTAPRLRWTGLEVLATEAGGPDDARGVVEFVAHHDRDGVAGSLHEVSRFRHDGGRWRYVRGRARWT